MLTPRDRARLAPHLGELRAARADLTAAENDAETAEHRLTGAKARIGFLGRWFGSSDPDQARAFHDARRDRRRAKWAIAEPRKRTARLEKRARKLLGPMMPGLDPAYPRLKAAIDKCDRASRECRVLQRRITELTGAARAAGLNPGPARARHHERLVAQAQHAVPTVRRAVEAAKRAVDSAGGRPRLSSWDLGPLDRLSRSAGDAGALKRLSTTLQPSVKQLDSLINTLAGWRAEAEKSRQRAIDAVLERLVKDTI